MKIIGYFNMYKILSTTHFIHMGIMEEVSENTIIIDKETKTILINPIIEKQFINEARHSAETIQEIAWDFMNKRITHENNTKTL